MLAPLGKLVDDRGEVRDIVVTYDNPIRCVKPQDLLSRKETYVVWGITNDPYDNVSKSKDPKIPMSYCEATKKNPLHTFIGNIPMHASRILSYGSLQDDTVLVSLRKNRLNRKGEVQGGLATGLSPLNTISAIKYSSTKNEDESDTLKVSLTLP